MLRQGEHIQRTKSLESVFQREGVRAYGQFDEAATANGQSWSAFLLNAPRPCDGKRERLLLRLSKLTNKTGRSVSAACTSALGEFGAPLKQMDFLVSDDTSSNSSLKNVSLKGGAYAHTWAWMRRQEKHVLLFFIRCQSHVAHNEFLAVLSTGGYCVREHLLHRTGARNEAKSGKRLRLLELLADLRYAVLHADRCVAYLRVAQGLEQLGQPPSGTGRWLFWLRMVRWLRPLGAGYDHLLAFLLHTWLEEQGSDGIALPTVTAADGEDGGEEDETSDEAEAEDGEATPPLSGARLAELIASIKDVGKRDLLQEMADPEVRTWLCFLQCYGSCSCEPYLHWTESDDEGKAFDMPRMVRERRARLALLASIDEEDDQLDRAEMERLSTFVSERGGDADDAREIVRTGAAKALEYFTSHTAEWVGTTANPALLVLGVMDEEGGAAQSADELLALYGKQGRRGLALAMMRHMPEGDTVGDERDDFSVDECLAAVEAATDGPCAAFSDEMIGIISALSELAKVNPRAKVKLSDVSASVPLQLLLVRLKLVRSTPSLFAPSSRLFTPSLFTSRSSSRLLLIQVPVGNFIAETVFKTLKNNVQRSQLRSEAYATLVVGAVHRTHRYEMSDADYRWASKDLSHNNPHGHGTAPEGSTLLLSDVADALDEGQVPLLDGHTQLQAAASAAADMDQEEEEDGAAVAAFSVGRTAAGAPRVSVRDIRRALTADESVIDVHWQTIDDTVKSWPVLVNSLTSTTASISWLCETDDDADVLVVDARYEEEPWLLSEVTNTCLDVREEVAGPHGERRWRRGGVVPMVTDAPSSSKAADAPTSAPKPPKAAAKAPLPKAPPAPTAALHGRAGRRRSSAGTLSCIDCEWLSDAHLGNGNAADHRPADTTEATLHYNYPRPASLVPSIFSERPPPQYPKRVTVQQFCVDQLHWWSLALVGPEQTMYVWEPLQGSGLDDNHAIVRALRAAAAGWQVQRIAVALQADGFQCGVWAHWFRGRVFDYAANSERLGSCTLGAFLLHGIPGLTNLLDVEQASTRRAAGRRNGVYIQAERDRLRALLQRAAKLPGGLLFDGALLDDFIAPDAPRAQSAPVYVELDD
jgi:hypothetical protein